MPFCQKLSSFFLISILLLVCGLSQTAGGTPASKGAPNILLLTIDTLRPDHLGCCGYKSVKTPHIDRLAQEGVLFTHAYSPVPLTLPSHVSIMTGQYPIQHGIHDNGIFVLEDSANTMAEILRKRGYTTGAVLASYILASQFGLNQGFDYYNDDFNQDDDLNQDKGHMVENSESSRRGEMVTDLAKKWLKKNHQKPFFLWVHYFDPHYPYDPPAPFDSTYKDRPYDGEIAYLDTCLGRLFKEMRKLKILENTCIIFVGDHGEGLWEHQEQTHGLFTYNTTLQVPLIISHSRLFQKGARVNSLVRTIDIMPTLLESLSIEPKQIFLQGTTLVPLLTDKRKDTDLNLYFASRYPELNFNWAPLEGIITSDGWKFIQAPKPELYNLKEDPHERVNLYSTAVEKAQSLQKKWSALKESLLLTSCPQENARQISLSPEIRERLSSLGYIWSSETPRKAEDLTTLPDSKDKAPLLARIDMARELEIKGQLDQAIQKYEEVLNQDPGNKMARYCLGLACRKAGKIKEAAAEIEKVAEQDPHYFNCHNILGLLYDQLALPEMAIREYKEAIRLNPEFANTHNNLGMVYLKINDFDSAVKEFRQTLSLHPDPMLASITHANLGGVYVRKGHYEKAIEEFVDAINLSPDNREARISLADTYYRLGKIDQSINKWKKILKMWPQDYLSCFKLGKLYIITGQTKQAALYLRKCLQIRPDFFDARILLQQISQNFSSAVPLKK